MNEITTERMGKKRKKYNYLLSYWILTSCQPHRVTSGRQERMKDRRYILGFCRPVMDYLRAMKERLNEKMKD